MTAELTEGSTYLVKATTTNMSTKAGVPVAATLTVNIAAVVNSQIIMEDSEVYGFAADETHTFEFSMAVPMGTGGKAGAVVAEVLDPNGKKLADGSLDVVIGPPLMVSEIAIHSRQADGSLIIPTWCCFCRADIEVTNLKETTETVLLTFMMRHMNGFPYEWTDWYEKSYYIPQDPGYPDYMEAYNRQTVLSGVLGAGETKTFSQVFWVGAEREEKIRKIQIKFVGPFGEVISEVAKITVGYNPWRW